MPVDENEVGWREIPQMIGELKKMIKSIVSKDGNSSKAADDLQEIIMQDMQLLKISQFFRLQESFVELQKV